MKNNKKATLGLSVEIIVIIIISLVVLSSGLVMLRNFISISEEQKAELDQRTSAELERLLVDQGQKVALPLHSIQLYGGDSHVFGLGIRNIGIETTNEFYMNVKLSKYVDELNEDKTEQMKDLPGWLLLYNNEEIILNVNDNVKESILVKVPKDALKGQYIFSVEVNYFDEDGNEKTYGSKQRFTVLVQ